MKINLGAGDDKINDYLSVDLFTNADIKADVRNLPFHNKEIEEIFASHIIEHFDFYEAKKVLKEWYRILQIGGKLIIETPDFYNSCVKYSQLEVKDRQRMWGHFFAKSWIDGETHKFLYDKEGIYNQLYEAGFRDIKFENPTKHLENPNIRIIGIKI